MSGPKGITYRVESAAELRRRNLAAARAQLDSAEHRWAQMESRCHQARAEHGDAISALVRASSRRSRQAPDAILDLAEQLRQECDQIEGRLRRETAAARSATMMARISATIAAAPVARSVRSSTISTASTTGRRSAPDRGRPTPPEAADQRAETVQRIVSRLDGDVPAAEQRRIEQNAAEALQTTDREWRDTVDELRFAVQKLNAAAELRRTADLRRLALQTQLDGLPGHVAQEARDLIIGSSHLDNVDWGALESAVIGAVAAGRREADRQFAAEKLAATFAELGFEVEEPFTTLLVRDGVAHVRSPDWDSHAVRVRMPSTAADVGFNVVSTADAHAGISIVDVETEREWCSSFDKLRVALVQEGVMTEVSRKVGAGELPVQRVAAESLHFSDHGQARARDKEQRR